jgi:hypothetical protein
MMTQTAIVVLVLLLISGCSFLPAPLAYLNYARTGYDVTQIAEGEATTTDNALSAVVAMDCKLLNALDGEDICIERPKE